MKRTEKNEYRYKKAVGGHAVDLRIAGGYVDLGWVGPAQTDTGEVWFAQAPDGKIFRSSNRSRATRKLYDYAVGTKSVAARTAPAVPVVEAPLTGIVDVPTRYRKTRESWLMEVGAALADVLAREGYPPGKFRVSVAPLGRSAWGCCYSRANSADACAEVFINAVLTDPLTVAAVLAHELIHAALPRREGHSQRFRNIEAAIGLLENNRQQTAKHYTPPTPKFIRTAGPILRKAGQYPHERLHN